MDIGQTLPELTLPDGSGEPVSLKNLWDQGPLVVFFYPKDGSPGCTKQMCSFGSEYAVFKQYGAQLVGVSQDSAESHEKIAKKHSLPFPLLSDAEGRGAKLWGVPKFMGLLPNRYTVVIDTNGRVVDTIEAMLDTDKHIREAKEAVRRLVSPSQHEDG